MDERPELYELDSIEQLRGIADPLRLRIIDHISEQAMTATQLGEVLDEPPNKVHYHVRELERLRLVKIVETREKGGILEKYYQTVAVHLSVPKGLLQRASPDESVEFATELLQAVVLHFTHAFSRVIRTQAWDEESMGMVYTDLWLTPEEYREVTGKIKELVRTYDQRGSNDERRKFAFLNLSFPAAYSAGLAADGAAEPKAGKSRPGKGRASRKRDTEIGHHTRGVIIQATGNMETGSPHRIIAAGRASYSRADLERLVDTGQRLDLHVLGTLSFSSDVTPELVDAAINSVRHRGLLNASPEVKAALKLKGAKVAN